MPFSHLLLLRYILLNVVAIALLVAAYFQGWVGLVVRSDATRVTIGIAALFVIGLIACSLSIWRVSREIDRANSLDPAKESPVTVYIRSARGKDAGGRANLAAAFRHRLFSRIVHIRHIANTLVVIGLIGTVIGFIIALSGVDPDIATNPNAVSGMVARLIEGMSVALYTTLVGAILSVWLLACFQMLATGTTTLFSLVVELGEGVETGD
jgi:uncharacterized membrane protein (DUF485 family)